MKPERLSETNHSILRAIHRMEMPTQKKLALEVDWNVALIWPSIKHLMNQKMIEVVPHNELPEKLIGMRQLYFRVTTHGANYLSIHG